jgi:hypothetical protein
MSDFTLTGLDGANPLGFLAALGAFRILNEASPARMFWTQDGGKWTPVLRINQRPSILTLARILRSRQDTPPLKMANNPQMPLLEFREAVYAAREQWFARVTHDLEFIAALGDSAVPDRNNPEINADTAWRTMSGSGHQHFLKFINEICKTTSLKQLREALFDPWRYADTDYSMRWDPADDRRYALRWQNPSTDKATNVRGANRLAIEALPLFPVMPTTRALETTGFSGHKSSDTFFTWPIWMVPINLDVCRSLLAHAELQRASPATETFASLGVSAAFRSQRITVNKFRNFTPARQIAGGYRNGQKLQPVN